MRKLPQEVEQGGDGYCGLSGNDGTARSPPQEVEQGHGRSPTSGGSPGGTPSELKLGAELGSRRSPGEAVLQSMSRAEPGSRRSPGGAVLLSRAEPGSRRSPGGAVPMRISTVGILYPTISIDLNTQYKGCLS